MAGGIWKGFICEVDSEQGVEKYITFRKVEKRGKDLPVKEE